MKTRIVLSVLVVFSTVLLLANFRLSQEANRLREEQRRAQSSIGQRPIAATQKPNDSETSRENEQLRKNHDELIRLRNHYGLLRDRVDGLEKENQDFRRKLEESEAEIETQRLQRMPTVSERQQARKEAIATLEKQLTEWSQDSDQAKRKVIALAESANLSDAIAQLEASAGLKNPKLQQYWPYFEAQKELDHCVRVIDAIRLRIETEKAELRSTTSEN